MKRKEMLKLLAAMRTGAITMERQGEQWTHEEVEVANARFLVGIPVSEIAIELKRSEFELYDHFQKSRHPVQPKKHRGCMYTPFMYKSSDSRPHSSTSRSNQDSAPSLLFQHRVQYGYREAPK